MRRASASASPAYQEQLLIASRIVYEVSRAIWRDPVHPVDPVDPVAGDKCDSCHQRAKIREKQLAVWEDHQLVVRGETFHVHDFVLFDEGRTGEAWSIGHIASWPRRAKRNQPKLLEIRLLKRQAELVHSGTIKGFADEVSMPSPTSECKSVVRADV